MGGEYGGYGTVDVERVRRKKGKKEPTYIPRRTTDVI